MTIDVEKLRADLRAGLEGVTPGPWRVVQNLGREIVSTRWHPAFKSPLEVVALDEALNLGAYVYIEREDADHIARCSPDNIAALLDDLATARADALEEAESKVEAKLRSIAAELTCWAYYEGDGAESVTDCLMRAEEALEEVRNAIRALKDSGKGKAND